MIPSISSKDSLKSSLDESNIIYRSLIICTIFTRIFTDSLTAPNTKTINCTLTIFSGLKGNALLNLFGQIHRQAHLENILLKHNLPKELFLAEEKIAVIANKSWRNELEIDSSQQKDSNSSFESRNAKHVRFLLAQLCLVIPPLFTSNFFKF